MKIAIYSRGLDPAQRADFHGLLRELEMHKAEIILSESLAEPSDSMLHKYNALRLFKKSDELDNTVDCMVTLGGDGTMLDAATLIRNKGIPLLGLNFGRLGFLASLGRQDVKQAVDALVNRSYIIDQRTLVHIDADVPLFTDAPFALNEFVLHKRDFSSMIKIHTYLNGEFLNTYWADGLIVATPTGSTGYNLSCNGPVTFPDSRSFVITPIAPHNLNVRSIVVPDDNIISFEVEGRATDYVCSLDARRELVNIDVQVAVKKEDFTVGLIRLNENSYLETLRSKLAWGLDVRN